MAKRQYYQDKTTVAIYEQDRELIDEIRREDESVPEVLSRVIRDMLGVALGSEVYGHIVAYRLANPGARLVDVADALGCSRIQAHRAWKRWEERDFPIMGYDPDEFDDRIGRRFECEGCGQVFHVQRLRDSHKAFCSGSA